MPKVASPHNNDARAAAARDLEVKKSDERALKAQALSLAVHNREAGDTSSGEPQVARARRYLDFLKSVS
jgi:hypothetical protein